MMNRVYRFALAATAALALEGATSARNPTSRAGTGDCVVERRLGPRLLADLHVFGFRVAIDGDTAVVAAVGDLARGEVYVFTRTGGSWNEQAKLFPRDRAPFDVFGQSVALDGDTLVVGASGDDDNGTEAGSAYVYVRSGTAWTQQAKLLASDGGFGHSFGSSVAVSADVIVVGAWGADDFGNDSGAAYVFARNGTTWTEQAKLIASDGHIDAEFGISVSVAEETVLVGAHFDDDNGPGAGSAYVFTRTGTTWTERAKLLPSDGVSGDNFGAAVSIDSDTALVTAPVHELNSGAVYVFVREGTAWSEQAKLVASDASAADFFGNAASLDGNTAVVGSFRDDPSGPFSGSAYVFVRSGTSWGQVAKLTASDGSAGDDFGTSVAVSGTTALVGAPGVGSPYGAAYSYALAAESVAYCTAKRNSCATLPAIGSSGCPSASEPSGFSIHATHAKAHKFGVLLYTDSGRANLPFQGGTLCVNTAPLKRSVPVSDSAGTAGQCDGILTIDMNAFAQGLLGGTPLPSLLIPGTRINSQWWGRDTPANGSLLSNGLEYVIGP